jgi:thiamine transporter
LSNTPGVITRSYTFVAAAAALAIVLGYFKLYRLPQGGSITLETVPILFIALWKGPRTGIQAGIVAGLLKLILDPFIIHPVQILLDYPIPFACLGCAAFSSALPRLGIVLGNTLRFACHLISGVVFFSSYAPDGSSVWYYSAMYNASYILPEALIALFIVPPILRRISSTM